MNQWERSRKFLLTLSVMLFSLLLYQVIRRAAFPWDLYMWSESPFLTNMLKLSAGQSIYSPPADANSFVYSPGLEYLCYVLLAPFGLQLDVRFCRLIPIFAGMGAAYCAARAVTSCGRTDAAPQTHRFWEDTPVFFIVFALVIFENHCGDVCHPDNLHIAHFAASVWLVAVASSRGSLGFSCATMVFLGVGVLLKQNAAGGVIGGGICLLLNGRGGRSSFKLLSVAAAGACSLGASLWFLFSCNRFGKFYTLDLLRAHGVHLAKLEYLVSADILGVPHRAMLYAAVLPVACYWFFEARGPRRDFFRAWLLVGCCEALPGLVPYLKLWGTWNNLTVIDVWAAMIVFPTAWGFLRRITHKGQGSGVAMTDPTPSPSCPEAVDTGRYFPAGRPLEASVLGGIVLWMLTLLPHKAIPADWHRRFCEDLENRIGEDLRAGKTVLLAHGTMMLIHNGVREPPLDRANSYLELNSGREAGRALTVARIASHKYDRVYLNSTWYGPEVEGFFSRHYRQVGVVQNPITHSPPSAGRDDFHLAFGFQKWLWNTDVRVLEPADKKTVDPAD